MNAVAVAVAIVGVGPSGVGVLERLGANAPELLAGRPLEVHLVDPYPAGPGRVWRHDQSPLLTLNTVARHVTMFTDETVACAGPIRTGPSLLEWSRVVDPTTLGPAEEAERAGLTESSFPTRRLQSHYLTWVYERAVAGLPAGTRVHHHRTTAVDLDEQDGRQRLLLADGRWLEVDVVVLAVGHQDVEPATPQRRLAAHADHHGLWFLPPGYAADTDLSPIRPGEPVIVRGLGLAFVDLMVLLTEGRGGSYQEDGAGGLRYRPSGREPVLYVGSRRGVPPPPKPVVTLVGPPPPTPRFFRPERILAEVSGTLDFFRDVWPAAAREIAWGHYHELFTGHPERVRGSLDEFLAGYAAADWDSPALAGLIRRSVPDRADRFDPDRLDRPLRGESFPDAAALQRRMRSYLHDDLVRATDPRHSPDLGTMLGVVSVFGQLPVLLESGRFSARSQALDVDGWWAGVFNRIAVGPPLRRIRELLALSEAGVVRFVGPDMWVRPVDGAFAAGSPSVPGTVTAAALVEARLPVGSAPRSRDLLVRNLYRRGRLHERTAVAGDFVHRSGLAVVDGRNGTVLDAEGRPQPGRFALGPFTTALSGGNFTRPGSNPVASRLTDAVARSALLAAVRSAR
ncbi:FAD/NAD(P)-binding protein [Micromonospora cathayae]|uniref:FAD/NAD(P)-binding protein n=1 Tax=Micromonospora cathayae TaxID=3028804 RepID=A0ABY7ZU05_9ACTN|nr:FAD/NAD(P)-binding protein [Micromonospora sp. HUAS 3]WDZ86539.1 FAD/NAD(P)-binding protein [Micromonospora sp. HUAS 3]